MSLTTITQSSQQKHTDLTVSQFDLTNAYRLLIGAYIRAPRNVKSSHSNKRDETKSR